MAVRAMAMLRRAGRALEEEKDGPASLPQPVRTLIDEVLSDIYQQASAAPSQEVSESHRQLRALFACQTWMLVLARVKEERPRLFNALNLATLELGRPSVWEDPASCSRFSSLRDFLLAWQTWYQQLDRTSQFWLEDAPRIAAKKDLDVEAGFAGLLLFDVMCVCTARSAVGAKTDEVPFAEIASFAAQLPACRVEARHSMAQNVIEQVGGMGANAIFVQEAPKLTKHLAEVDAFLPPFCAADGLTAVILRRDDFPRFQDITASVRQGMEALLDPEVARPSQEAWRTTCNQLAAVCCQCRPEFGSYKLCLVSLHCSKKERTAVFLGGLRDVLAQYEADLHIVGMASNCDGQEAAAFQRRLRSSGFDIGCQQDQVTVAKQRTYFQTQILKAGQADIAHKDYVVSWGATRVRRLETRYMPDLRTAYGVEQETKQCVRLPTTQWPFDHCSVAASFKVNRHCTSEALCRPKVLCSGALICVVLATFLLPFVSVTRAGHYGEPGDWFYERWPGTPQVGLCKGEQLPGARCAQHWIPNSNSCYKATPSLSHDDAHRFCRKAGAWLVSIGSEAENQFLTDIVCPPHSFCWIGLRSSDQRQRLSWDSGEPFGYSRLERDKAKDLFPLFPLSRDTDFEVAVLSTMPDEVTGCHIHGLSADFVWFRIVLSGISAAVTTVLLTLPRRKDVAATRYLVASFIVNYACYITQVHTDCFSHGTSHDHHSVVSLGTVLNYGFRGWTSMWSCWMILRRMRVLYPVRFQLVVFRLIVAMLILTVLFSGLFVDMRMSMDPSSWAVVLLVAAACTTGALYVLFSVPIAADLYRTWAVMKREATRGCSTESSKLLDSQVRASRLHFFSVLAAVGTGALRHLVSVAWIVSHTGTEYVDWITYVDTASLVTDTITNDLCTYIMAAVRMDEAVKRVKGITADVARRARYEVDQHKLAVGLLKAASTSERKLRHFAHLETKARAAVEDPGPFLLLQSAVNIEAARIHHLMRCVRLRAMTMPLRYQYLLNIPTVPGVPRQAVPEQFAGPPDAARADAYFKWLYSQSDGAQHALFQQVKRLIAKFNNTPWPSDLGLVPEQFPWTIWPGDGESEASRLRSKRLQSEEVISPGEILLYDPPQMCSYRPLGRNSWTHCIVLKEKSDSLVRIQRSGAEVEEEVRGATLRRCQGGAVFVPGPKKRESRCLEKIASDYEGKEDWPAAASLVDICRCQILLDDPYAMAVLVAYIRTRMHVVRLKNRFNEDAIETIGPMELQSMFYSASEAPGIPPDAAGGSHAAAEYRDISMNVQIRSPSGSPFICEIQVTLSNLAILKHADTALYTIRRMRSPRELLSSPVFSDVTHKAQYEADV